MERMETTEKCPRQRLLKVLYTGTWYGIYSSSFKSLVNFADSIATLWVQDPEFYKIVEDASNDPYLPKRDYIFYVLARMLSFEVMPLPQKTAIKKLVLKVCKNDEDFFNFIKFYTKAMSKKNIPTTIRKLIKQYYEGKTALQLAESVAKQDSYHGWTHRDMLNICHFKSSSPDVRIVLDYIYSGRRILPKTDNDIAKILHQNHTLLKADEAGVVNFLPSIDLKEHLTIHQINSKLNKSEKVWQALIPYMTLRELLHHLNKFHHDHFLESKEFQHKINQMLNDTEKIKASSLHPLEIYIYKKIFETGGKPTSQKLIDYLGTRKIRPATLNEIVKPDEPQCNGIIQNLEKCLKVSSKFYTPTNKRFMITIDVTERMRGKCHKSNISCFDAAYAIIKFVLRTEKAVIMAMFKNGTIHIINGKKEREMLALWKDTETSYILQNAPLDYAISNNKEVDVFMHFMASDWDQKIPDSSKNSLEKLPDVLDRYATAMSVPDAKVVRFFLNGSISAIEHRNILTISGLTPEVPQIFNAFVRGSFS